MHKSPTILIVDDEPRTRQGLRNMLEAWSGGKYEVKIAEHGQAALEFIALEPIHLLITDIRMPEISGLDLVKSLRSAAHKPEVILISGYAEFEYAQQGIELGVTNYLLKPIHKQKLIDAVEQAMKVWDGRVRMEKMQRIVDRKLIQINGEQESLSEPIREAIRYVERHLDKGIGLKEVADHVHLNASYFSSLFKDQMQMTFIEYMTRLRIQKAKAMLIATGMPIAEIAERVGYQTTKYFSRVFKEYEGHSPGVYRSEVKGQSTEI